jgi:hypothetical protein
MAHTISMAQLLSGLKPVVDCGYGEGILWHKGGSGYDGYHGSVPLLLGVMGTLSVARFFSLRILSGLSLGFYRNGFEKTVIKHFAEEWNSILVREFFQVLLDQCRCRLPKGFPCARLCL